MPDWKKEIQKLVADLGLLPTREAEIVEELAQHLEDRSEELLRGGASEEEVYQLIIAELSDGQYLARELRRLGRQLPPEPMKWGDIGRVKMITDLWQDLRYGVRMLGKNPGFTLVVTLMLALGIGANAALFSVVNGVLLQPLPYPQPEQLVTLHASKPNFDRGSVSYLNFRDWQKENHTFTAMAVVRGFSFSLIGTGEAERLSALYVSADFFSVLGITPAVGRDFATGEDESGAAPVALISAAFWQRKFASAQDVIGKSINLDDRSYTIIGVIPASFKPPSGNPNNSEVFVPIGQWNHPGLRNRGAGLGIHGIGRLKPGVTVEQAQADLDSVAEGLAATYPATNKDMGARVISLKERMVGDIQPILWLLLGAVGFVLLIACVNVSNLLLARSTARTREFAIRAALGAGQWRLLRQLLTESILLALLGGGMGLLVAAWGTHAALSALPTALPRAEEVGLDGRVLIFTFAVSLLTGILSGLAPALKTSQGRLAEALKEGGRGASPGRQRAQGLLVAVEVGLALVLLIGAGLMIRSLNALWNVDLGFRADQVSTFGLSLPPAIKTGKPEAIRATLRQLSEQLISVHGVRAASFSFGSAPLQSDDDQTFWRQGQAKPETQSEMDVALVYRVEPSYLSVMGIPLKQGRFFNDQDNDQSPSVIVIDEVLANKYFPNEDPLGQRLNLDGIDDPVQIVGVVGHVNQWGLDTDDQHGLRAQFYEPFAQLGNNALARIASGVNVVVRTEGTSGKPGAALFDAIRRQVQSQNGQNTIFRGQTMNEIIAGTLAERQFSMILLEAFAAVALLLASIGLYGVISYLVGQRTHELGIRLALGAQRRDILSFVLKHGMKMALGGVALGLFAALSLTRLLAKMLYGVTPTDPVTFVAIAALLAAVALMASYLPALRATRVDPLTALRHE